MKDEKGADPGSQMKTADKKRKQPEDDPTGATGRGPKVDFKKIVDKKLRGKMKHAERVYRDAQVKAQKINEYLLPGEAGYIEAEGMERTFCFTQEAIASAVEVGAANKIMNLRLPDLGPYSLDFTRSGRYMAIAGTKGHLALMDWQTSKLMCEVQVRETTRDVTFLHNELFFAAAQKKYVYIYDQRGIEIHCLKDHVEAHVLDFLPHHFLLTSIGELGVLRYQDTSTGMSVANHRTKLGPCRTMAQNPYNAVMCCGHTNGTVTMWTPNVSTPVVKMQCHRGPVQSLVVDQGGHYMATAGIDNVVRVWDVRTFQPLLTYRTHTPATSVSISQKGLLAVGCGRKVGIWKDAFRTHQKNPYLSHELPEGRIQQLAFCPYDDVLGIGHSAGISTILVPGAGEPNFDSYVANPFQGKRERREQEVVQLLDKLQPDSIVLDPDAIGRVTKAPTEVVKERHAQEVEANLARVASQRDKNEERAKMKGKNRPSKRHRKKQNNIIDDKKAEVLERMREQEERKKAAQAKAPVATAAEEVPRALQRFYKK